MDTKKRDEILNNIFDAIGELMQVLVVIGLIVILIIGYNRYENNIAKLKDDCATTPNLTMRYCQCIESEVRSRKGTYMAGVPIISRFFVSNSDTEKTMSKVRDYCIKSIVNP